MGRPQFLLAASAIAWLVAVTYSAAGVTLLSGISPRSYPIDLRLRWTESRLTADGLNPQTHGHPDPELPASHKWMKDLGGSYPPWSYPIGLLMVPPFDWRLTVLYFAILSMTAMAGLSGWAFAAAHGADRRIALLAAALPLTNFAMAICVSYGQYAVLVAALLVSSVLALERGRPGLAGILLGLAFVKPQLAAPFALALAAQGRLVATVFAALTVCGAWLLMASLVNTAPLQLISGTAEESSHFHYLSMNPLTRWLTPVIGRLPTVLVLAIAGAATAVAFASRVGARGDPLRVLAATVIVAMFWSYRRHYDVALMSIPLVYSLIVAVRSGKAWRWGLFLATGLTLWLPVRHTMWESPWVLGSTLVVWMALLASFWTVSASAYRPPMREPTLGFSGVRTWLESLGRRPA